jgi:hypothetical protein
MLLSIRPVVRFAAAALFLLSAQATSVQPGAMRASPAAVLFLGGIQPELAAWGEWQPLGAAGPFDVARSVTSVGHYPDVDPLPEGADYIPSSALTLVIAGCR